MTDHVTAAPWYCPTCSAWNGTKLPRCLGCDRPVPRLPVTTLDVPADDAAQVTTRMRVRGKARRVVDRCRRGVAETLLAVGAALGRWST
jgi:hypothetical protein